MTIIHLRRAYVKNFLATIADKDRQNLHYSHLLTVRSFEDRSECEMHAYREQYSDDRVNYRMLLYKNGRQTYQNTDEHRPHLGGFCFIPQDIRVPEGGKMRYNCLLAMQARAAVERFIVFVYQPEYEFKKTVFGVCRGSEIDTCGI